MKYLISLFVILFISIFIVGCGPSPYAIRHDLAEQKRKQAAETELNRLTLKIEEGGEEIVFATTVHFYLRRWENANSGEGWDDGTCSNNDLLIITDSRIYVSENFITDPFYYGCAFVEGDAALRPQKLYTYEMNSIDNIEWFVWHGLFGTYRGPTAFSVNYSLNNGDQDRFYIAVGFGDKPVIEGVYDALNKHRELPYIDARGKATYAYEEHYCRGPGGNQGPQWKCENAENDKVWHLYMKIYAGEKTSFWESSWFKIPNQWVGPRSDRMISDCSDDIDLWSSDKDIAKSLVEANHNHVLYIGDNRAAHDKSYFLPCRHKYKGFVSTKEFTITNCEEKWFRVGGRSSGLCKGMDGVKVRRYTIGEHNCYLYEKVNSLKTIDEHHNRQ